MDYSKYKDRTFGVAFFVHFVGYNDDPGQFEIVSDDKQPLKNVKTFHQETVEKRSTNLFYDPIPFEMLKTYETKPQVMMTVNGQPAVCHNLNCDFTYKAAVGEIATATYDKDTKLMKITGTKLPSKLEDIQKVTFALAECTIDKAKLTATAMECTLKKEPTCGDWKPIITTRWGQVPHKADLAAITVTGTITGILPSTEMNVLGFDNLTMTGKNLPHNLEESTFAIEFTDGAKTKCKPQSSETTKFVCLTAPFDKGSSLNQKYKMKVVINGQTINTDAFEITTKASVKASKTLDPSSVSPVLKTKVTITLDADFPHTLKKEDFTVNATSTKNATYIRYMRVVAVDDAKKQLTCMFGGAESGKFTIAVRHAKYGIVDTKDVVLDVSASVTKIEPNTGSIHGGNMITVTGKNFGTQKTDNPVQIHYDDGSKATNCFV